MAKNEKTSNGGFKAFLKSRRARHGSLAIAIVIAVTALVVVLNIIVGLLVDRFPSLKADFTANSAYALQEDTEDYLSHMSKDAKLYILSKESDFESGGQYFVQAKNLLEKMVAVSDGKLTLEYVDVTSNPSFTSKYGNIDWKSSDVLAVVECGEQYQGLTLDECFTYNQEYYSMYGYREYDSTTIEQAVVTGVLNVATEDKVVVDFLKIGGEADYSTLKSVLTSNAYQVNEVSLLTADLDEDAKFAVIFAPTVDLDEETAEKLQKWLENDGKYGRNLIYIPSPENVNTPNAEALIEQWGMKLTEGFAFETSEDHLLSGGDYFAFITDYGDYYTENMKNKDIPVMVYQTRGIEVTDENNAHALLKTSSRAGIVPYEPGEDWKMEDAITGSPIAVAAEGTKKSGDNESKLIIFGSDRMFASGFMKMNSINNTEFIMSVFNTTSDKDNETVTITGKSLANTELGVTDLGTTSAMMIVFVAVLPLGILLAGIIVWIRRRNK
ncbi:MAG: Gldg family protein [Ruminococcus sp.]